MKRRFLVAWLLGCLAGASAQAQDSALTKRSAAFVFRADVWVAKKVQSRDWLLKDFVDPAASGFSFMGMALPFVAVGTWAYGGIKHDANARAYGRTTTEAFLLSSLVTGSLKGLLGRARPYVTADTNAGDFQHGRGWKNDDYRSMPSGHSTVAFAFASALTRESLRIRGRTRLFNAAMYTTAASIGLSRIVLDKHWMTDVLMGAVIGTLSGSVAFQMAH